MRVKITGPDSILLQPEYDADYALLERWNKMRAATGGATSESGPYGFYITGLSIVFRDIRAGDRGIEHANIQNADAIGNT